MKDLRLAAEPLPVIPIRREVYVEWVSSEEVSMPRRDVAENFPRASNRPGQCACILTVSYGSSSQMRPVPPHTTFIIVTGSLPTSYILEEQALQACERRKTKRD